jgi:4-amino-4-deoxy-L-arabinose transferase-like glycosyltransferase
MITIVIFILAFFVRIYNLSLFPLNHDEAAWSLSSIHNFDKFIGIPVACFNGYIQPFFSYLVFITKKIFSSPEYIVRIPAVIIGVATVILIYQLAKEMYGKKAALISASLLCFLPWHVIQSRIGVSLILTPFFGCLIFYALFRSLEKRSAFLFVLSWVFLAIGSFYTYQVSLLFIPIFLIALLWTRKDLHWLQPKVILLGVLMFLLIIYPLVYLQLAGQLGQYWGKIYRMYYHDAPFEGTVFQFLIKAFINLKDNISGSFKGLFFTKAVVLNAQALDYPLMISYMSLLIIICSVILSIYHRKIQDKILLTWLGLGYIGAISGVRFYDARYYITVILPPLLIFIGRFIAEIFKWRPKKISFKREFLFFTGITLILLLVLPETWQLVRYYYTAPMHLDECRYNSYGCKETAQYLSRIPYIKDYTIVSDSSMEPLYIYLNYYLYHTTVIKELERRSEGTKKGAYYIIWAPESHPKDYRNGEFSWLYDRFHQIYPGKKPFNTIFYPNGLAAIHIFKVEEVED